MDPNMERLIDYSDSDVDLLARLMRAEAIGEGEHGMLLVGNVVVNRVLCASPDFKKTNTVQQVVYQTPGGFSGVKSELFKTASTEEEKALAKQVLDGNTFWPASRALWFYAPSGNAACQPKWFNQQNVGKFKNHCFYIPDEGMCMAEVIPESSK